jgi:hypothetical protein
MALGTGAHFCPSVFVLISTFIFLNLICVANSQSTASWVWMGGSNTTLNDPGEYGQLRVASIRNRLPARAGPTAWYESSARELWIYGGFSSNGALLFFQLGHFDEETFGKHLFDALNHFNQAI